MTKNNSKDDPRYTVVTATPQEAGNLADIFRKALKQDPALNQQRDESIIRLHHAEARFLITHGWRPIPPDGEKDVKWVPPLETESSSIDLIEQDVAVATQKNWNKKT